MRPIRKSWRCALYNLSLALLIFFTDALIFNTNIHMNRCYKSDYCINRADMNFTMRLLATILVSMPKIGSRQKYMQLMETDADTINRN